MTFRQALIKILYPIIMLTKKIAAVTIEKNVENVEPPVSFYTLSSIANTGKEINFSAFSGKKVLIVNTASDWGFTPQYSELQKLHEQYGEHLIVVGFPSNDFKEQEKRSDEEIAQFCKVNYGVTFTLMKKTGVIKSTEQNSVFRWLTDAQQNGWNDNDPGWNFTKYLVNENGVLTHCFPSQVSPLDKALTDNL